MKNRSYALDALRGYAIITMVLSGTIASGILPAWMYHAQTPPPRHSFDSTLAGITWVDLVFPFFLFAMGAAFAFSVGKKIDEGKSKLVLSADTLKRGLLLAFFAVFINHFYPWNVSSPQDVSGWMLSISCFVLLFPVFMRMPFEAPKWVHWLIQIGAIGLAILMLNIVDFPNERKFDPAFSNIIILILANTAFFGTILYIFTHRNKVVRVGTLFFIMGISLGSQEEGSIAKTIFEYSPLPWLYGFGFLKYLLIVIPGSIAGEYVYEWMQENKKIEDKITNEDSRLSYILPLIGFAILLVNLVCLFNRWLVSNLFINIVLLTIGCFMVKNPQTHHQKLWQKLFYVGTFLVLLGLCFESFQGGIKKDHVTYSYLFLTSGLGFMAMIIFHVICDFYLHRKATSFLIMPGQNPMIAYVVTYLFTIPVLQIIGVYNQLAVLNTNPWLGFLKGVILTSIAVLITMFFTKIKWFWRT